MTDFDISTATSDRLGVTQRVGAWAFERGCAGIVFLSRLDPSRACWAIFERRGPDAARVERVDAQPVDGRDPNLRAVVDLFGLSWPLPAGRSR